MTREKQKHLVVLLFATLFSIALSGSIDYTDVSYSNMDMNKYISMAEASPGIDTEVIRPFVYRIAAPWIVGILPFSIPVSFAVLNSISLLLLSIVFYFFLIEYGVKEDLSLLLTIIFQFNRYFFQFLGWNYFQLSDTVSITLLFSSFIILRNRKYMLLFFIMAFGILVKEYMLMIIPAGFVLMYEQKYSKKELIFFTAISIASLLVFWGIRKIIPTESGESLFTQYITQVVYYSSPKFLIKRFIIPFAPFALLPIIFLKDLMNLFMKEKHLFVYLLTVIVLSFFGESERLMAPLAAVYFLYVATLVSKYLIDDSKKIFTNKKIYVLIIFSFLTSLYHLWGIIKLPNRYYSVIILGISTIVVSILFVFYSIKRKDDVVSNGL